MSVYSKGKGKNKKWREKQKPLPLNGLQLAIPMRRLGSSRPWTGSPAAADSALACSASAR